MSQTLMDDLNPEQRRAVSTHEGPLLIIAGAGSGKTRVITLRIASLLDSGIPQRAILALTFTNKAAREMYQRVREVTGSKLRDLTVSTFHSFGVTILKQHAGLLGYRDNFTIYDSADQLSLLKETAREISMEIETGEAYGLISQFSSVKSGRTELGALPSAYQELYKNYQEHLLLYNAVDFDDLIEKPIRILREHSAVREQYQERFSHFMVDEFQDTSADQYALLHLLSYNSRNVAVVGDDDQSIYSWRGANFDNFLLFEKDFPEFQEIKLEQNYRSTETILAAANGVIANNANRKVKSLWSNGGSGRPIELTFPEDDTQESLYVADVIKTLSMRENLHYADVGVLVRTNSLARQLEVTFLSEKIPYTISGGESFFSRKEIKDVISYMRVLSNPDDDVSLLRILNTPRRGIGRRTLEHIIESAQSLDTSLYDAIGRLAVSPNSPLPKRAQGDLEEFVNLIHEFRPRLLSGKRMAETIRELIDKIDYWAHLLTEHPTNDKAAKWKHRNMLLFTEILEQYEEDPDVASPSPFEFLTRITLDSGDSGQKGDDGKVQIMTIHAAKGLEHKVVFVIGCEDGIIPHARAIEENPANIEEERRLFYVAITRAREKLYLTSCRTRRVLREIRESQPSPFLEEIPRDLVAVVETMEQTDEQEGLDYFAALKARLGVAEEE
jgi:DNA helicase-2/ATP-dependent DNA helicase PcrA